MTNIFACIKIQTHTLRAHMHIQIKYTETMAHWCVFVKETGEGLMFQLGAGWGSLRRWMILSYVRDLRAQERKRKIERLFGTCFNGLTGVILSSLFFVFFNDLGQLI